MRILMILLLAMGLISPVAAKTNERTAVLAAVDRFMVAFNTDDPVALAATQLPEGMTFALVYKADGTMTPRPRSNAAWVERAGKSSARLHERYWSPKVMIHRDMAVFWAPYSFDVDGKRTHCGIDVFELIKVDGEWKIANAMWTIEPDGCRDR